MKQKPVILNYAMAIFALTILGSLLNAQFKDANNLVANGNFGKAGEWQGREFPESWFPAYDTNAVYYDKTGGKDGQSCIFIRNAKPEATVAQGVMQLVPGEKYKISGYLKTKGFKAKRGGVVVVNCGWTAKEVGIMPDKADSDWKYYENVIVTPETKDNQYSVDIFAAESEGGGEIGVCDIRLEALTENGRKNSKNPYDFREFYQVVPLAPLLNVIPDDRRQVMLGFPFFSASEEVAYECRVISHWNAPSCFSSFLRLFNKDKGGESVCRKSSSVRAYPLKDGRINVVLSEIPVGKGELEASIVEKSGGKVICKSQYPVRIVPALDLSKIKPLNTLASEITRQKIELKADRAVECSFSNPRAGWIFVGVTPGSGADGVTVSLSSVTNAVLLCQEEGKTGTMEAMRKLDYGEHRLRFTAKQAASAEVIVRSVPELLYDAPNYNPYIKPLGNYDWKFLEKYVFRACNAFIRARGMNPSERDRAIARGMSLFGHCNVPGFNYGKKSDGWVTMAETVDYWASRPEMSPSNQCNGFVVDEFVSGIAPRNFLIYARALDKIYQTVPRERLFYPYVTGVCNRSRRAFIDFLATVFNHGGKGLQEAYCESWPTMEEAKKHMEDHVLGSIKEYRQCIPDAQKNLIFVPGYYVNVLSMSIDNFPEVDYKYYLDMQLNLIANSPEFQDLYGLSFWCSGYADEETMRWAWRLVRHYAIEGRREMLSDKYGFRYLPGQLVNGDFAQGTNGWTIAAAEEGAVRTDRYKDYGLIEQRFSATKGVGETFLVMRRSEKGQNRVSQTVKNLIPGNLYSLKLVVADLADLKAGKSRPGRLVMRAEMDNIDVIPDKTFVYVKDSSLASYVFDNKQFNMKNPFCANLHRIVFRAKAPTATLTLSDWASANEAGGPAGQELIINFIQMKPYFENE